MVKACPKKSVTISVMLQHLQIQLTVLFTAFVLLVVDSVGVTYWGIQTQQQDALVIKPGWAPTDAGPADDAAGTPIAGSGYVCIRCFAGIPTNL